MLARIKIFYGFLRLLFYASGAYKVGSGACGVVVEVSSVISGSTPEALFAVLLVVVRYAFQKL